VKPKQILGGEDRGDPCVVLMLPENGEADTALFDDDVGVDRSNCEVFADLGDTVDSAVAGAYDLKDDDGALDEVRCSASSGAGDNGIRVADGIADCGDTVVRSKGAVLCQALVGVSAGSQS
jgi:hypothetical protein